MEKLMRRALLAGLVLAVVPAAGLAQSAPYHAVVTDAGTKLRAGPSDQFPETATLPKGFQLLVDHEEPNGWLAVQDVPGHVNSVSWVQTQYIDFHGDEPLPQLVTVDEAGTTLRAGQIGLAQPLHVQRAKVPGGTILTVIGKGVKLEEKTWYPVVPPPGDFRYLPKQAVKADRPATTSFSVGDSIPAASPPVPVGTGSAPNTGAATGGFLPPAPGTPPATPAAKPTVQHPLWAKAEAAEKEGRFQDAEAAYFELARVMNQPGGDHDIANLCYTRIHSLREKRRGGGSAAATTSSSSGKTDGRTGSLGPPIRATAGDSQKPASPPPDDTRAERGKWTGPGKLVRSALALDGRRTYALESSPGVTGVFVVAGTGVDLEKFVNKKVDIYGVTYSRQDLSRPYVVAGGAEVAK
jgi:hypothetical protein